MEELTWRYGRRISEKTIAAVERRIGHKFPATYRELVREHDGAYPARNVIVLRTPRIFSDLYTLVPDDPSGDLLAMYELRRDRLPSDVIPFGNELGSGAFCFDYRRSETPAIVYWDGYAAGILYSEHGKGTADAMADGAALIFVAPDFDAFLNRLELGVEDLE